MAPKRFYWKCRVTGVVGLAGHVAYALFFVAAAWFGEVALCRVGCALIAGGFCYSISSQWRMLVPGGRAGDGLDSYRKRLAERRDSLLKPAPLFLPSTHLGVALACLGWILSEPRRWPEAVGLALFYLGLRFMTRQISSSEAGRLQKEIDLLGA